MHHSGNGKFAIRQGDWVLIDARTGDDNGERGEPDWFKQERGYAPNTAAGELYDLRDDLPQRDNLYAAEARDRRATQGPAGKVQSRRPQHSRSRANPTPRLSVVSEDLVPRTPYLTPRPSLGSRFRPKVSSF